MKLTDALMGEHGAFRSLLDGVEEMASYSGEVAQIDSVTAVFTVKIMQHAKLEEDLLFSALEPFLDSTDLCAEIHSEHLEINQGLESIEDARDLDQAIAAVHHTLAIARLHFDNEEKIFYAIANKVLDEKTLTRLGEKWALARSITI
jgi:hypothetical protein